MELKKKKAKKDQNGGKMKFEDQCVNSQKMIREKKRGCKWIEDQLSKRIKYWKKKNWKKKKEEEEIKKQEDWT